MRSVADLLSGRTVALWKIGSSHTIQYPIQSAMKLLCIDLGLRNYRWPAPLQKLAIGDSHAAKRASIVSKRLLAPKSGPAL